MAIIDSKNLLWKYLKSAYTELQTQYPDKIKVDVLTEYPQQNENHHKDMAQAYIIIRRSSTPEEVRFLDDAYHQQINQGIGIDSTSGNLQTEYFDFLIMSTNPQYRDDIYNLTKFLIFKDKKTKLLPMGLRNVIRLGGRDEVLDQQGLPTLLYKSTLSYLVQADLTYTTVDAVVEAITITQFIVSGKI